VLIVWRIEGEEEMLVAEFGGEYWEYRRKTRKLFPYFY
jgi:protein-S-isoprenylcysteine O-methyltransferase Ste14